MSSKFYTFSKFCSTFFTIQWSKSKPWTIEILHDPNLAQFKSCMIQILHDPNPAWSKYCKIQISHYPNLVPSKWLTSNTPAQLSLSSAALTLHFEPKWGWTISKSCKSSKFYTFSKFCFKFFTIQWSKPWTIQILHDPNPAWSKSCTIQILHDPNHASSKSCTIQNSNSKLCSKNIFPCPYFNQRPGNPSI